MAKTRTQQPLLEGFGALLKELHADYETRKGAVMSHDAIARIITDRNKQIGGPTLSFVGSTLWRWEEGQVGSPDPYVLRELAAIYDADFYALMDVLVANRSRRAMTLEEARYILQGNSRRGSTSPATEARVQQLEQTVKDQRDLINEIRAITGQLFRRLYVGLEDGAAEKGTPSRRASDRAAS
jgi:transcriptional regulator with XRE-family HTH domain